MPEDVIEEWQPLPRQPDAEPRFTMSGMGVTIQGDLGGIMLAMEQHLDATADDEFINDTLDKLTRAWHRQRARASLRTLLLDVERQEFALTRYPVEAEQLKRDRAADRARLIASFHAKWDTARKRGDYQRSTSEQATLDSHDRETEAKIGDLEKKRDELKAMIPVTLAQVEKLRRQIAGHDPVDQTEEPLRAAAE